MKILNLEKIDRLESDTAIALGFYDGIHIGHKKILSAAIEAAKKKNLASAIFTFARHPMEVINPGLCFPYLTTFDEKNHARVAYEAWIGGCDVVKDDENLTSQNFNNFKKRFLLTIKACEEAEKKTGEKKVYLINCTAESDSPV